MSPGPRPPLALVGPTPAAARRRASGLERQLSDFELRPLSLSRFLADRKAPIRVVVCPGGASLAADLAFLESIRRRVLWPAPGVDLWGAIAGLRGSHDAPPRSARSPGRSRRTSALLLEGDVTPETARRAARSAAPRLWVVERIQRVRIPEAGLESLRLQGIRWSVLEPVEVMGIAASPALAAARSRWKRFLPAEVPVWVFPK
jgi:hypothetical protein